MNQEKKLFTVNITPGVGAASIQSDYGVLTITKDFPAGGSLQASSFQVIPTINALTGERSQVYLSQHSGLDRSICTKLDEDFVVVSLGAAVESLIPVVSNDDNMRSAFKQNVLMAPNNQIGVFTQAGYMPNASMPAYPINDGKNAERFLGTYVMFQAIRPEPSQMPSFNMGGIPLDNLLYFPKLASPKGEIPEHYELSLLLSPSITFTTDVMIDGDNNRLGHFANSANVVFGRINFLGSEHTFTVRNDDVSVHMGIVDKKLLTAMIGERINQVFPFLNITDQVSDIVWVESAKPDMSVLTAQAHSHAAAILSNGIPGLQHLRGVNGPWGRQSNMYQPHAYASPGYPDPLDRSQRARHQL